MSKQHALLLICTPIQLMFSYAAISKWMAFEKFVGEMHVQPIPHSWAMLLPYLLPPFEILIALSLFPPLLKWGLWLSAFTMLSFTTYIALGLLDFLGTIPCSCGGILGTLSIKTHLLFNVLFLALSVWGIFIIQRKEVRNLSN